ncbi:hypothetical protein T440DRAFT_466332 [Plenodomus tracheiphilus IPT5]|uniref:Oxidase ustYa n=1 Tax=Plenodomus tracheiphilus IPT5 TaxID=1408161 RepID=A0A6A7BEE3_9PLEO|nr:hypothetical protein T440DRAFT_466332 [Plenodomus tracheiphilus IPT5]
MSTKPQPTMNNTAQPYDSLPHTDSDSHSHSDSSTEIGDWDPERDGDVSVRPPRRKTTWRRISAHRWILDTTLLLVILGLLVEKRQPSYEKPTTFELLGDVTSFMPSFSQRMVRFRPEGIFAPEDAETFFGNETQEAWLGIVPAGLGYVNVKNASNYSNLPQPIHDYPSKSVFTTSVTHQLHCLYTILSAYNTQKLALDSTTTATSSRRIDPVIKMPWHINHCFDYLRQAVMCSGDVALEGAATTFPEGEFGDRGGSDGWDGTHVCRDYGEVKGWLEGAGVNDFRWIGSD